MESNGLMSKTYSLLNQEERETAEVYDNSVDCLVHFSEELIIVENIGLSGAQWFEAERIGGDCFDVKVKVTERQPVEFTVPDWWVFSWVREAEEKHKAPHIIKGTLI